MAKDRTGYIYEENGKWFARITFTDSEGKRRNLKRTAKTKTEAKKLLKKISRQVEDEGTEIIETSKLTFNDLADYYEKNYAKPAKFVDNQKVEGLRDLKRVKYFLKHFREYFGTLKLSEINYDGVVKYRAKRLKIITPRKTTRSLSSMNRELAVLRRIFNIGIRKDFISKNPVTSGENLIQISGERRRERILTLEEEKRLLEVITAEKRQIKYKRNGKEITATIENERQHLKPLVIALLDTGARKSEMKKLTWQYVDFSNRLITFHAMNTKTLKTRQVAMTKRLYKEFQNLWHSSNGKMNSLVLGKQKCVRKAFKSACEDANIPHGGISGITLHSLRHTAASRLVKGQMPIQMVGRILGHTQPQTTYRYLTADDETLYQASEILESFHKQNHKSKDDS